MTRLFVHSRRGLLEAAQWLVSAGYIRDPRVLEEERKQEHAAFLAEQEREKAERRERDTRKATAVFNAFDHYTDGDGAINNAEAVVALIVKAMEWARENA